MSETNLLSALVAGVAASVFQTTVSYPFEFLKTSAQLHRAVPGAPPAVGPLQFKHFFAGCGALNVGNALKTGSRFYFFDMATKMMADDEGKTTGPRMLAAGAITGFMESFWVIPSENIKTTMVENALLISERAQKAAAGSAAVVKEELKFHKKKLSPQQKAYLYYEQNPSTHMLTTVREIYSSRGMRGFFQGAAPTFIRQCANSAVRFTAFTSLRQIVAPKGDLDQYWAFGLGAFSSMMVVAITQPIDVIKTRMQSKYTWYYYKNSINCAYRIFVEEGVKSFWKGWAPRLVKVGLSGGVSFGVYQYVENVMTVLTREQPFR